MGKNKMSNIITNNNDIQITINSNNTAQITINSNENLQLLPKLDDNTSFGTDDPTPVPDIDLQSTLTMEETS